MYKPRPNEKTFQIKPLGVKYICEHCHEGEMISVNDNIMLTSNPPLFAHKCNKCGGELQLPRRYPYIEWIPQEDEEKELI